MIKVTRINGIKITINAELIEIVESTPDTIISLTTGKKFLVKDTVEEVIDKVLKYRQDCFPYKKYKILKSANEHEEANE